MSKELKNAQELVAVIDIGTSAIRMVLAEVGAKGEFRYLENLQKPVRFGKDVFKQGVILFHDFFIKKRLLVGFKSSM